MGLKEERELMDEHLSHVEYQPLPEDEVWDRSDDPPRDDDEDGTEEPAEE